MSRLKESAPYDSQSNGLAESVVKDVKDAVRTIWLVSSDALDRSFREDTQS